MDIILKIKLRRSYNRLEFSEVERLEKEINTIEQKIISPLKI